MALNLSLDGNKKKPGISPTHPQFPPTSPHSQITMAKKMPTHHQNSHHNFTVAPSHSRSLSQSSFFSFDHLLPPLCPSPLIREPPSTSSADVALQEGAFQQPLSAHPPTGSMISSHEPLPPRIGHRRSSSDIPLGLASTIQPSPPWEMPSGFPVTLNNVGGQRENVDMNKPIWMVKQEFGSLNAGDAPQSNEKMETEGEAAADDLFSTYMNLDHIGKLNSSSVEDKENDMDSVESGTKTNVSSENEVESGINGSCNGSIHGASRSVSGGGENHNTGKRSANGDIAPTSRHYRSLSMDSFMGLPNFNDESPRLPPSPGIRSGQHYSNDMFDGDSDKFRVEFGNSEFSALEMKKIMANEKLAEIALADPKRAKRILANRQSAARSKERKLRYIAELEHRVQTLQAEATTLSAQLTLLQRDSAGLTGENNELRFRLQAMEQQAHLRNALHEALTTEVQRLKIAASETRESSHQHMSKNNYQPSQYNMYDLQHLQQNQNQMKQELQSPQEDEASKS